MTHTIAQIEFLYAWASSISKQLDRDEHSLKQEAKHIGAQKRHVVTYFCISAIGIIAETMIFALALAGLQFPIMGHETTGLAFFGIMPVAFVAYHIATREEGDETLKSFYGKASRIGLIIFTVAASALIGTSFIQGGIDSLLSADSGGGWAGTNGGTTVTSQSDLAGWDAMMGALAGFPIVLFGIALCFSLVLTMRVVSWAFGKFLTGLRALEQAEARGDLLDEVRASKTEAKAFIKDLRAYEKLVLQLPPDPDKDFAQAYFAHVSKGLSHARADVSHAFRTSPQFNHVPADRSVQVMDFIRVHFDGYRDGIRHIEALRDHVRPFNTLMLLSGNAGSPDPLLPLSPNMEIPL